MHSSLRKKLYFRAWHRGTREADLLMGRFAETFLVDCSEDDAELFGVLLAETDPDIYDWVTGRTPLPETEVKPLLQKMISFYHLDLSK